MNAIGELFGQGIVQRIGWALVQLTWQGAVVAALLAGGLWLLRRRSANARYLLACGALAALACLPALTAWWMPDLPGQTPSAEQAGAVRARPALGGSAHVPPAAVLETRVEPGPASWSRRLASTVGPALPYVVILWAPGVLVLSSWRALGFARARRLKTIGTLPVGDGLAGEFAALARLLGVRRRARVVRSRLARVPAVVGYLRPVVLLPASALTRLTCEQLRAVLAHELAHILRHDYLVNLFQTVVETLLFYHPAVWWISSRVRAERENCCDDLAAAACPSRYEYAHALVAMAELCPGRARLAVAANGGTLLGRVRRLLSAPGERSDRPGRWLAGVIAIAAVVALAVAIPLAGKAAEPARAPGEARTEASAGDAGAAPSPRKTIAAYAVSQLLEQLSRREGLKTKQEAASWLAELIRRNVGRPSDWQARGGAVGRIVPDAEKSVLLVTTTEDKQDAVAAMLESLEKRCFQQILLEARFLKLSARDDPQVSSWLATQAKPPLRAEGGYATAVPDKVAEELSRRIQAARSGQVLSCPKILLANYSSGEVRVGQHVPLRLPQLDRGGAERLIQVDTGVVFKVLAYLPPRGADVTLRAEAEVTEAAGEGAQNWAHLKCQMNVLAGKVLLLRMPARQHRLLGFRERPAEDGKGTEREFQRKVVDPKAPPESWTYVLIRPELPEPADAGEAP